MIEINLLPKREIRKEVGVTLRQLLFSVVGAATIFSLLLAGAVLSLEQYLSRQFQMAVSEEQNLNAQLEERKALASDVVTLQRKLTAIKALASQRPVLSPPLDAVRQLMGQGTTLNGFTIAENGLITLSVQAANQDSLADFFARLITGEEEGKFKKIAISNLRFEPPAGGFSFGATLSFFKNK